MTKPTPEWLEKWEKRCCRAARSMYVDDFDRNILRLIYQEVYEEAKTDALEDWKAMLPPVIEEAKAKARRETLEEARNLWRHFQQICIDANGCIHDFDAWLAEQLKEADGES